MFALAWRNIWRHSRRSAITVAAMSLGAAICMVMMAFTDGMFATMFDVAVTQTSGHVRVENPAYVETRSMFDSLPDAQEKLETLQALPEVQSATWRAFGGALLGGEQKTVGVELIGVDPALERKVGDPDSLLVEGRYLEAPGEVVIGVGLAEELDAGLGTELVAMTQASDGSIGAAEYTVVGIAKTGSTARDKQGAWLTLGDLQELLYLEDQVHEIVLLAEGGEDAVDGLKDAAVAAVGGDGVLVRTWREADPNMASMLDMGDVSSWILLSIIFFLAGFGVLNTMLMSVFERTREFGVMRALGMGRGRLVRLVLSESLVLALVGMLIGGALGGVLDFLVVQYGIDLGYGDLDMAGIQFPDTIKGQFRVDRVIATLVTMVVVALGASLFPAWRASQLKPIEAMRRD
ncbi:MAG: FtsX-like permease family protein [Myxococcota bacterium]|nr:FtsX-like permease family protein [Myxococcota bacterium]